IFAVCAWLRAGFVQAQANQVKFPALSGDRHAHPSTARNSLAFNSLALRQVLEKVAIRKIKLCEIIHRADGVMRLDSHNRTRHPVLHHLAFGISIGGGGHSAFLSAAAIMSSAVPAARMIFPWPAKPCVWSE